MTAWQGIDLGTPLRPEQIDALLERRWRNIWPSARSQFIADGGHVVVHPSVQDTLVREAGDPDSPWRERLTALDHRGRYVLTWRGQIEVRADTAVRYDEVVLRREERLTP
jgi:hypothetical protein